MYTLRRVTVKVAFHLKYHGWEIWCIQSNTSLCTNHLTNAVEEVAFYEF